MPCLLYTSDIGGVTLIRAAAKNYHYVTIVTDPADYDAVTDELTRLGNVSLETRQKFALKAFAETALYDSIIHYTLKKAMEEEELFPEAYPIPLEKAADLKYGENPYQSAALYENPMVDVAFEQMGGGKLSYNNLLDADAAVKGMVLLKDSPGCVIIKHTTPCGLAIGENLISAYEGALASDPVSAYGGIIGFTREVDEDTALEVSAKFYELIVAPSFSPEALKVFENRRPNLRLIRFDPSHEDNLRMTETTLDVYKRQAMDSAW